MATFFDTIKTRFDADTALTADGFSELFQERAFRGEDKPFCSFNIVEEEKVGNTFSVKMHEGQFTFQVTGDTQEDCKTFRDHIVAAFKDAEKELTVTGISVYLLEELATRYEEVEEGLETALWQAEIDYEYKYAEGRT